jgi:hypothetical protein
MKPVAWVVIGCALTGGCFREGLLPPDDVTAYPTPVQPGSALEQDIAAGYRAYGPTLAPLGEWSRDAAYGVKWCPRGVDTTFAPYRSSGHWVAADAPDAPPSWQTDSGGAAWTDITMHHGWWVWDEPKEAPSRWCWIPGAEPTAARVIWRTGDGFAGWAPEPPPTDPDAPSDDDGDLAWTFEFEGSLYDDSVDSDVLTDSAADSAYVATHSPGAQRSRTGPPRSAVTGARKALGDYILAHPDVTKPAPQPLHAPGATLRPTAMAIFERMRHDAEPTPGSGGAGALPRIPSETLHGHGESPVGGSSGHSAVRSLSSSPGYHPSGTGASFHSGHAQVASNHVSGGGSSFGGSAHSSATGHSSHGGGGSGGGGGCGGSSHSSAGHHR